MRRGQLLHLANLLSVVLTPTSAYSVRNRVFEYAGVEVSPGAVINAGCRIYGPRVKIGSSWLGQDAILMSTADGGIIIGDNCDIGPSLLATVGTHEIGGPARRAGAGRSAGIHIGDGCWLGARVTILPGVHIGPSCVVAAGAVVATNVPASTLVGGVPARVIRALDPSADLTGPK